MKARSSVGEGRARQLLFQPVGDAPAVELVLQLPIAFVNITLADMVLRSLLRFNWAGRRPGQIPTGKHITLWDAARQSQMRGHPR